MLIQNFAENLKSRSILSNTQIMKKIYVIALFCLLSTQSILAQTTQERLERAKAAVQAGNSLAAINDLSTILESEPNNATALAWRASAYFGLKGYEAALADSTMAISISPNFGWPYYLRGLVKYWRVKKDFAGALADFTKVIALDRKLAGEAYRYRADIHNQFDMDYTAAVADATEAIRLNPTDGNAYAQRGWANAQLKNFEKARDDYRQSIKLNFATSGVYTTLGFIESKLEDYDQAAIDTRKALELDAANQEAKVNLARIVAKQEQRKKAGADPFAALTPKEKAEYDKIFEASKLWDDVTHSDAQKLLDKGDYAGVLTLLTPKYISFGDSKSWEMRATANFKLAKYDDALKDMQQCLTSSYGSATASQYLLRGDIYKAKYSYALAEADYRAALKLSSNDASIKQRLNSLKGTSTVTDVNNAWKAAISSSKSKEAATAKVLKDLEELKKPQGTEIRILSPKEEDGFLRDDPSAKSAYTYWDLQDYEKVYENATESIKAKPTAKMYQLRAEAIINSDEDSDLMEYHTYAEALKDIDMAIAMSNRDLAEKHFDRGDIYVRMKDLAKALESYTRSIELDPKSFPPYAERGKIYMTKGFENWEKAVADFSKVAALDNTAGEEIYDSRAYAYFMLDKKAESAADFKKALTINPKDGYATYNLNMLKTGNRVLSMEEFKKNKKVYFV